MKQVCKHCLKPKEEHCEYEPGLVFPDDCVCDPFTWEGSEKVIPICSCYTRRNHDGGRCAICEHDKDCHVNHE